MYDITWQFGNFLLGVFGSFSVFVAILLVVWICFIFGRRMHLYLQEEKFPTFSDAFQLLLVGFLLVSLNIANSNAPKITISVPYKAEEQTPNNNEIINLAPDTTSPEEREANQRALDMETNNRTLNK